MGPEISLEISIFPARGEIRRAVGTLFGRFMVGAIGADGRDLAPIQDHI
ncbi:MAG: hypothetical protein H0T76_16050 [Nannocystis sp.]|nr:hypothetical protein [Nannocystis sp.]MBA3547996.1 hypothetical protein [Nannocystis sp.]